MRALLSSLIQNKIPTGKITNFTGGTYQLDDSDNGSTITTTNAIATNIFILPRSYTGYTINFESKNDQPISIVYMPYAEQSGATFVSGITADIIDTSYSKNYIINSGETLTVTCEEKGKWKFGDEEETIYLRFQDNNLNTGSTYERFTAAGIFPSSRTINMKGDILMSTTPFSGGLTGQLSVDSGTSFTEVTGITSIMEGENTNIGHYFFAENNFIFYFNGDLYKYNILTHTYTSTAITMSGWAGDAYETTGNFFVPGSGSYDGKYYASPHNTTKSYVYSNNYLENVSVKTITTFDAQVIAMSMSSCGRVMYAITANRVFCSWNYGDSWFEVVTTNANNKSVACSASGEYAVVGGVNNTISDSTKTLFISNFGKTTELANSGVHTSSYSTHSGKFRGSIGESNRTSSPSAQLHAFKRTHNGTTEYRLKTNNNETGIWNIRGSCPSVNADGSVGIMANLFFGFAPLTIEREK